MRGSQVDAENVPDPAVSKSRLPLSRYVTVRDNERDLKLVEDLSRRTIWFEFHNALSLILICADPITCSSPLQDHRAVSY
jgi:hypothetical protein